MYIQVVTLAAATTALETVTPTEQCFGAHSFTEPVCLLCPHGEACAAQRAQLDAEAEAERRADAFTACGHCGACHAHPDCDPTR